MTYSQSNVYDIYNYNYFEISNIGIISHKAITKRQNIFLLQFFIDYS